MNEKQMQVFFGNYLKSNRPKSSEVYELKITSGKSLPFNQVKEHQVKALLDVEKGFLYHKLTDPPIFYGMNTKFNLKRPFDCFCLVKSNAYLVIWFYCPRKEKVFYKIRINDFLGLKRASKKKSFTEEEAQGITSEVLRVT